MNRGENDSMISFFRYDIEFIFDFREGRNGVSIFFADGDRMYIYEGRSYPHWAFQWWYNAIDTTVMETKPTYDFKYGKRESRITVSCERGVLFFVEALCRTIPKRKCAAPLTPSKNVIQKLEIKAILVYTESAFIIILI